MKKRLLLFLFMSCIIGHINLFAQTHKVTGIVTDSQNGEPLPGAKVTVKATIIGVISDLNGKFTIEAPSADAILEVSFIGYLQATFPIQGQTDVTIKLSADIQKLDEVVVIGYGSAKKGDITTSTVTLKAEDVKGTVGANLAQALQGRVAGAAATALSGQPGSQISITIRGQGTLNANAEPLYVVDGIPIQNVSKSGFDVGLGGALGNGTTQSFSGLASINPNDIESYVVLKDAAATAIYGSRGANGVIIITTKSGKAGDAKFTYEGLYGVQEQVTRLKVMNLKEFAEYSNDWAAETNGRDTRVEFQDPSLLGAGTNWQDELYRIAPMQQHQISVKGGSEKVTYYLSGSYYQQDGTVIGTDFKRFTGRINMDAQLKKWFKLGTNITFAKTRDHMALTNSTEGVISMALNTPPDVPVKNADGTWGGVLYLDAPATINPIAKALDQTALLKKNDLMANFYSEITILKDFKLRTELGGSLNNTNAYTFTPTYAYGKLINLTNSVSKQYGDNYFWQENNTLTYTKQINKHRVSAMVGQEASEYSYEYLQGASTGLSSNEIQEPGLGTTTSMTVGSGHGSGALASVFSRLDYSFNDKYYIQYTYRYDGSSNFGPKNRWASFHAVSGSYRVTGEPFMESVKSVMNDLKLKASWGQTGNQNIKSYLWGSAITKMPTDLGMGYRQANIANPYIHWEKQESIDFGLEASFFASRIALVADWYKKTSSDMLMTMQLPSYMGTSGNASIKLNAPYGNFGKIENSGLEISLNTKPLVGKFQWDCDFQVTINRNKLIGLTDVPSANIYGYGQWTDVVTNTSPGQSLFNFYGYKVAGVYQNKADIMNSPKTKAYPSDGNIQRTTVFPGDLKFQDLSGPNGIPDGVIDEYDRTNIGSPLPKFTYGLSNTFRYKGLELTVLINGSYGNKLLNYLGRSLSTMNSVWNNQLQDVVNRAKLEPVDASKVYPIVNSYGVTVNNWFDDIDNVQVKNPNTNTPRAISGDPNNNTRISDRYIEDGSYLRFKVIMLAYDLPKKIIAKAGLQNMRVYVNAQNMWTITKYKGYDPEIGASQTSDYVYGMDNGRYPSPRIISFGVNLTF
jgi:TonB-dependent starch-binding outer membrane protein SusC